MLPSSRIGVRLLCMECNIVHGEKYPKEICADFSRAFRQDSVRPVLCDPLLLIVTCQTSGVHVDQLLEEAYICSDPGVAGNGKQFQSDCSLIDDDVLISQAKDCVLQDSSRCYSHARLQSCRELLFLACTITICG